MKGSYCQGFCYCCCCNRNKNNNDNNNNNNSNNNNGCSVLARTKYLSRHNAALKIPLFEMLKDMDLIESSPPWYSPVHPKPVYQNDRVEAYWDFPVYAEGTVVKSNRVDVRLVDKEKKEVLLMEMTCP